MTPLRQRFIEDMQLRGLASTTQKSYIHYVADYAKYYHTNPEKLDLEAIRQYELYLLHQKKMSPESINSFVSAVQFLYLVTLEMPWGKECFPRVRRPQKLPVVLSPEEIQVFFQNIPGLKRRAGLMCCYGAGLRISEAVAIRQPFEDDPGDIDSQRMLLRVRQGKGQKDRYVMLSPRLLAVLRTYWRAARPQGPWLFPSWRPERHMTSGALSTACREACQRSGLRKRVTAHTLRQASA
jgi:site-specific recombinase XerD